MNKIIKVVYTVALLLSFTMLVVYTGTPTTTATKTDTNKIVENFDEQEVVATNDEEPLVLETKEIPKEVESEEKNNEPSTTTSPEKKQTNNTPVETPTTTNTKTPKNEEVIETIKSPEETKAPEVTNVPKETQTPTMPTVVATTQANDYANQVLQLVNEHRAKEGIAPLTMSSNLNKVALVKSNDMKVNNYFSHNSPTFGSPFEMMKSYGVSYRVAAENIAIAPTPQEVVDAWMNSSGHKTNIMNPAYTQIGIGYVDGYWTQLFIG